MKGMIVTVGIMSFFVSKCHKQSMKYRIFLSIKINKYKNDKQIEIISNVIIMNVLSVIYI